MGSGLGYSVTLSVNVCGRVILLYQGAQFFFLFAASPYDFSTLSYHLSPQQGSQKMQVDMGSAHVVILWHLLKAMGAPPVPPLPHQCPPICPHPSHRTRPFPPVSQLKHWKTCHPGKNTININLARNHQHQR